MLVVPKVITEYVEWVLMMWVYIFFASTLLATSDGSGTQTQPKNDFKEFESPNFGKKF